MGRTRKAARQQKAEGNDISCLPIEIIQTIADSLPLQSFLSARIACKQLSAALKPCMPRSCFLKPKDFQGLGQACTRQKTGATRVVKYSYSTSLTKANLPAGGSKGPQQPADRTAVPLTTVTTAFPAFKKANLTIDQRQLGFAVHTVRKQLQAASNSAVSDLSIVMVPRITWQSLAESTCAAVLSELASNSWQHLVSLDLHIFSWDSWAKRNMFHVTGITSLKHLVLHDCIEDRSIAAVATLTNLVTLELRVEFPTSETEIALGELSKMVNLEMFRLTSRMSYTSEVCRGLLKAVKGMKALKGLHVPYKGYLWEPTIRQSLPIETLQQLQELDVERINTSADNLPLVLPSLTRLSCRCISEFVGVDRLMPEGTSYVVLLSQPSQVTLPNLRSLSCSARLVGDINMLTALTVLTHLQMSAVVYNGHRLNPLLLQVPNTQHQGSLETSPLSSLEALEPLAALTALQSLTMTLPGTWSHQLDRLPSRVLLNIVSRMAHLTRLDILSFKLVDLSTAATTAEQVAADLAGLRNLKRLQHLAIGVTQLPINLLPPQLTSLELRGWLCAPQPLPPGITGTSAEHGAGEAGPARRTRGRAGTSRANGASQGTVVPPIAKLQSLDLLSLSLLAQPSELDGLLAKATAALKQQVLPWLQPHLTRLSLLWHVEPRLGGWRAEAAPWLLPQVCRLTCLEELVLDCSCMDPEKTDCHNLVALAKLPKLQKLTLQETGLLSNLASLSALTRLAQLHLPRQPTSWPRRPKWGHPGADRLFMLGMNVQRRKELLEWVQWMDTTFSTRA